MNTYPRLFEKMRVNQMVYRNRIVSAPMTFALSAMDPAIREKCFRKIEVRAKGGAAAVTLGELDVNFTDANRLPFPPIDFTSYEGEHFEVFQEYVKRIHRYGAIALGELCHAGAEKVPFPGQPEPVGPVETVNIGGAHVRAATEEDMERIAHDFAVAARFLQKAGFDGLTVHAGHGFIFTQFLSKRTNTRTDAYGGSLENRAAFPIRILKAIRHAVDSDFIIDVRVSAEEGVPDGITVEETAQFVEMIDDFVDSIHVSDGLYTSPVATKQFSSMFVPHGFNAKAAGIIKKHTHIPVGVIGGINSPELAEQILENGDADFVILGRQMICDPEFPNKAASGKSDEIRRCVRCYHCFPGSPEEGYRDIPYTGPELAEHVGVCALNPETDPDIMFADFPQPKASRKVLIIGGGPAGMEAAIVAHDRGHDVTLVDDHAQLGGTLYFTDIDVDKPDLRYEKNRLVRLVEKRNIRVLLNTTADERLIQSEAPDIVLLAIGAVPSAPPIKGLETATQAMDVFDHPDIQEKRIIMLGGGLVGCEVGVHLAKTGHEVTIVEMLDHIAKDSYGMYREALLREMDKCHIRVLAGTRCLEVQGNKVRVADKEGDEQILEGDRVYHALGLKAKSTDALKQACGSIPYVEIGNCIHVGQVDVALKEGYMAAMNIQ